MFFMCFWVDFPKPKILKKCKNLGFYQPCFYRIPISGGLTADMSTRASCIMSILCVLTPEIKPAKPGFLPAHKPGFTGLKTGGFTRVFGYPGCIP